jgi:hypothetical protein
MAERSLGPAHYTERRLLLGGALVFCSAVLVQLLQVPSKDLSQPLWVALWAAALAIPLLVAVLWAYAAHEAFAERRETAATLCMWLPSLFLPLLCACSVFRHFSEQVGAAFLGMSAIAFLALLWDGTYHGKINQPTPTNAATEQPPPSEASP